jgi:hypothetical protein
MKGSNFTLVMSTDSILLKRKGVTKKRDARDDHLPHDEAHPKFD